MKKTDKVVVYLNKIFHFVNAFCCTWGMVVIFIIVPITGLLKWPTIALLIQVVFLLGGFILLGKTCSLFEYEIKTENDEGNHPKEIFNRREFRIMIDASIVAVIVVYYELMQYFRNDGGVSFYLLIGTISVVIGAMISIEDLFYGKSLIDAVKEAIGLNTKDSLSLSVGSGAFTAFFLLSIIAYSCPRHVENEAELSYTRNVLIVVPLIAAAASFVLSKILKKKKEE